MKSLKNRFWRKRNNNLADAPVIEENKNVLGTFLDIQILCRQKKLSIPKKQQRLATTYLPSTASRWRGISVQEKTRFREKKKTRERERERVSASEEIRQRAVRDHLSVAAARRKSVDKKRFRAVHWLADTRQESQTSSNQKITSTTTFLDTLREKKNQQQKKNFF